MELKSYKEFLTEKTFRLGKDVDYIYNKFFKKFVDTLHNGTWNGSLPKERYMSSSELKNVDSKKAHAVNPIKIYYFSAKEGNYYSPLYKLISLDINRSALGYINVKGFNNLEFAISEIGDMGEQLSDDVSERRIKGTIYHELSHWIDDSLHNKHILKMVDHAKDASGSKRIKILNQDGKNPESSHYEVNAQIHAIKQMKRQTKKKDWDSWTWDDLVRKSAALTTMVDLNKASGSFDYWKKELLKRMSREKLLGKKMKYNK